MKKENIKNSKRFFYLKLKVFLFFILLTISFSFFKSIWAAETLNGAAWWGEDLDYLYFNCNDYETGSRLDLEGNFQDPPEPLGFKFYIGGCVIDHQVKIDQNGNFFGSAWNFKKGIVNFGGTSTPVTVPDYGFNSNCLNPCNASNNCSACYNSQTQRIYGYAQVKNTGELIRLDSNSGVFSNPKENNLQLKSWNMASSTNPFYDNLLPGDFMGHASSTINGVRQPLSFNCLSEYGEAGNNSCSERDYKVFLGSPSIGQMSAPNWSFDDACSPGKARGAILRWNLKSGSHTGFEVAVTKSNNLATSSPEAVCYSGIRWNSALQYNIPNPADLICKNFSSLEYNQSYYWFVRLWYLNSGVQTPTQWYQFGVNDAHEGAIYDINNGPPSTTNPADNKKTFTTYKHEFPNPYFTWDPVEIEVGATTTIFTALSPGAKSKYYTAASPNVPIDCNESGDCSYNWSVLGVGSSIYNPESAETVIVFNQPGAASVILGVRDQSNYYCTKSILITEINYGLPVWREIKAE